MPGHGGRGGGVPQEGVVGDLVGGQIPPGDAQMIRADARTAEPRLDAALLAAVARMPGQLVCLRPRQGVVSPLACDAVRSGPDLLIEDPARAGPRAHDEPEHQARAEPSAVHGLGEREAVGVVRHADRPPDRAFQILVERGAVETHGVGVAEQAGARREGARSADAHAAGLIAELLLQADDELGDGAVNAHPILGGGHPLLEEDLALARQHHPLDLRASEIDADPQLGHSPTTSRSRGETSALAGRIRSSGLTSQGGSGADSSS